MQLPGDVVSSLFGFRDIIAQADGDKGGCHGDISGCDEVNFHIVDVLELLFKRFQMFCCIRGKLDIDGRIQRISLLSCVVFRILPYLYSAICTTYLPHILVSRRWVFLPVPVRIFNVSRGPL